MPFFWELYSWLMTCFLYFQLNAFQEMSFIKNWTKSWAWWFRTRIYLKSKWYEKEPSNLHNVIETIGLTVITKLWLFFICRIKDKIEVKQNIQNFWVTIRKTKLDWLLTIMRLLHCHHCDQGHDTKR